MIKSILPRNLPGISRCQEHAKATGDALGVLTVVHNKCQSAIDAEEAIFHKFITNPEDDYKIAIAAIVECQAARKLQSELSARQDAMLRELQQDPSVIDDLVQALGEVVEAIDSVSAKMHADEKRLAADRGIDYKGKSPTLVSLETLKVEYQNALSDIDNQRDNNLSRNLWAQYSQLIS